MQWTRSPSRIRKLRAHWRAMKLRRRVIEMALDELSTTEIARRLKRSRSRINAIIVRAREQGDLPPAEKRTPEAITGRVREVARRTLRGESAVEIARELGVCERTVVRDRKRFASHINPQHQPQLVRRGKSQGIGEDVSVWPLADEPPPLDADGLLWRAS